MGVVSKQSEVFHEIQEALGLVPTWVQKAPESSLVAFWGLMRDFYLAETKIPNKYKELIGIAVSGATRCKYCQVFHAEAARLHGATDDEIAEASMMSGVTMLGSTFINSVGIDFEEFKKETLEIVEYVKEQQQPPPPPTRTTSGAQREARR